MDSDGRNRRAIYLLPNMITTLALFTGFVSVVASIDGQYQRAAVAIIVAAILDALDGRIARLTKTTSLFGIQYDSLSDVFAFGAAPALLVFTAVLHPFGRFGWLGAFLFLACGALRLARYNVQAQRVGEKHFTGLPIPAAGGMIAISVLLVMDLAPEGGFEPQIVKLVFIAGVYALSFLMVSAVPYPSFKQIVIPRNKAFQTLALVVLMLAIMANYPIYFLFGFGVFYIVVSPIIGPWLLKKLGILDTDKIETFTLEDDDILEDQ